MAVRLSFNQQGGDLRAGVVVGGDRHHTGSHPEILQQLKEYYIHVILWHVYGGIQENMFVSRSIMFINHFI